MPGAAAQGFRELRLEKVSRAFGGFAALRDVDLTVRRGEFVALLGPSGCGKSTALNCIAGLLAVTGGAIWLDERRIDGLRPEQRGFGMVFQNYALFPHMTLRRNVGFGLRMQRRPGPEIERRVDAALALVRLGEQGGKLPGQISGGQQQRVAIARAIAVEPPLVLMDEPLSNLDAKLRLEMRAEIRRIHDGLGSSTIYVTHDQDEALSMADRIVVLRDGAIRQVGTPEALYARPAHADVAAFMGFRNLLPVMLHGAGAGVREASFADAAVRGVAQEALPAGPALLGVRPEDVSPVAEGGIEAVVVSSEYRGRDFYGLAQAGDGTVLYFRSGARVEHGEAVRLGVEAERGLFFPAEGA